MIFHCVLNKLQSVFVSLQAFKIPFFGKSSGGGVKRTLANVDDVLWYARIFLLFITVLITILICIWVLRLIVKKMQLKKLRNVVKLLHRIQSDLVFLQEKKALPKQQLLEIELSKKETIGILRDKISTRFFVTRLGRHSHLRLLETLDLMENEKITQENQLVMVEQWLKTIDVLCR